MGAAKKPRARRKPAPQVWDMSIQDQTAWCRTNLHFDPLGVISDTTCVRDVRAVIFITPPHGGTLAWGEDRIYRGTRPVGLPPGGVLPAWTHLARVMLDAGALPLTGDDLTDSPDLTLVRAWLEARLLAELVSLPMDAPEMFAALAHRAATGLGSPRRPATVAALLAQLVGTAPQPETLGAPPPAPAADMIDPHDQGPTEAIDTAKRLAAERRRSRSLRGWNAARPSTCGPAPETPPATF